MAYNNQTVNQLAKTLGIPEEDTEFLIDFCYQRGFIDASGLDRESLVVYLVNNKLTWKDIEPEAAKYVVERLQNELECVQVTIFEAIKDLQNAKSYNEIITISEIVNGKAKKAKSLQIKINNICKDFPNEAWTQNFYEALEA